MRKAIVYAALLITTLFCAPLFAQVFVYPAKGQSPEQTEKDKQECRQWAQTNSGVNPSQQPPPTSDTGGSVAKGMVGGALTGLAIGNIAGGSGSKGAAAGALFGGVGAGARSSRQNKAQQQSAAQSQANFDRAYTACLEGRGYTVN